MTTATMLVTDRDRNHLQRLIDVSRPYAYGNLSELNALQRGLQHATVIPTSETPPDLVTMNSQIIAFDVDAEREEIITLVFPALADPANGRVSVLTPAGASLLGSRTGDTVEWNTGAGRARLRINDVTRPQAKQATFAVA